MGFFCHFEFTALNQINSRTHHFYMSSFKSKISRPLQGVLFSAILESVIGFV